MVPCHIAISTGLWGTEPSVDATLRPANLKDDRLPSKRPSPGKRASRALARFLITFCMGVGAILAWQSYGDAAREMIASSSPARSAGAPRFCAWTGLAAFRSQKNMAVTSHARARAPKLVPGSPSPG